MIIITHLLILVQHCISSEKAKTSAVEAANLEMKVVALTTIASQSTLNLYSASLSLVLLMAQLRADELMSWAIFEQLGSFIAQAT